jgi:hypothetical protein
MSIQKIKVIDDDTLVITTTDNEIKWFKREELKGPERSWFDNILACSISLVNYNPPK